MLHVISRTCIELVHMHITTTLLNVKKLWRVNDLEVIMPDTTVGRLAPIHRSENTTSDNHEKHPKLPPLPRLESKKLTKYTSSLVMVHRTDSHSFTPGKKTNVFFN